MNVPDFETTTGTGEKTRVFLGHLIQLIAAPAVDLGTETSARLRPAYLAFGGTESAVKAIMRNVQLGRAAIIGRQRRPVFARVQYPKKTGLRWTFDRLPGSLATVVAYIPALFELDAGPLAERVSFIHAVPAWWLDKQPDPDQARATFFAAHLDRRTALPILNVPSFHRALYQRAIDDELLEASDGGRHHVGRLWTYPAITTASPFDEVRLFDCTHEEVEHLVRDTTRAYFEENREEIERHGQTRITGTCRLLPDTPTTGEQLSLFG